MLTFYHCPGTRSVMILTLLEEAGAPYTIHKVDVRAGAGGDAHFRAASPYGKVPAIRDENCAINETGAIAIYLADKLSAGKLAPTLDDPRRGDYLRWIITCVAAFDPALVHKISGSAAEARFQASLDKVLGFVKTTLASRPYLLGDELTTPDILLAFMLRFAKAVGALPDDKVFEDYLARNAARPASKRAQEIDQKLSAA
ncbi:MAG: glutathione S-transferase [Alphaproteobacteria bacterium]|nr:glutathione S-transferase [Alphaproteobacteria bacterium]